MANQSGPIEIINPGNGLPNNPPISPNSLPCQFHHDPEHGGGPGGGSCNGLNPPICPPHNPCVLH